MTAWLYRLSWNRWHLDAMLDDWIARPFIRLFQWFDQLERRWTAFLSRQKSAAPLIRFAYPAAPNRLSAPTIGIQW